MKIKQWYEVEIVYAVECRIAGSEGKIIRDALLSDILKNAGIKKRKIFLRRLKDYCSVSYPPSIAIGEIN